MQKMYLSGKITDEPDYLRIFHEAELELQGAFEIVNPCTLPHDHGKTYEEFMKEDIAALLDCDVICMLPGWVDSRGALLERSVAEACGLVVVFK